jgi:hypothetical protein
MYFTKPMMKTECLSQGKAIIGHYTSLQIQVTKIVKGVSNARLDVK